MGRSCCEKIRDPLLSCNLRRVIRIGKLAQRWKIAGSSVGVGCRVTGGHETFLKNRTLRSSVVARKYLLDSASLSLSLYPSPSREFFKRF